MKGDFTDDDFRYLYETLFKLLDSEKTDEWMCDVEAMLEIRMLPLIRDYQKLMKKYDALYFAVRSLTYGPHLERIEKMVEQRLK